MLVRLLIDFLIEIFKSVFDLHAKNLRRYEFPQNIGSTDGLDMHYLPTTHYTFKINLLAYLPYLKLNLFTDDFQLDMPNLSLTKQKINLKNRQTTPMNGFN